jgi:glutamine amidotransferase-like uncharacterized protein
VRFVGPREELGLTAAVLSQASIYAQPGGGELEPAYRHMHRYRTVIRDYVAAGGGYLGFCLGGYLAGATPGFALLPGDTDQFIVTRGAAVATTVDTVVDVVWRGHRRSLFFQDGPVFLLRGSPAGVSVLAYYPTGRIAALTTPFGAGVVGVVGPHPEATHDWYSGAGLARPAQLGTDLGHDLIDAVLAGAAHPAGPTSLRREPRQ